MNLLNNSAHNRYLSELEISQVLEGANIVKIIKRIFSGVTQKTQNIKKLDAWA
jgi:hypothetical protein